MTAKHRGKKNKHNHEDFNHLNHESSEPEARGGNQNALLFILFLMIVVGGATGAWFCFQQHQSITYLADNFMGMQMKMVTLQSFQEEIRQTNEKQHSTSGFELRLNTLEESYTLAQKQVVMALAMAEQLKTLDLPTQVLSLHTEMKAQLAEIQQATVSMEQLTQLQAMLKGKSEEFEAVRLQVEGLAGLMTELAQSVEGLTGSLAERAGLLGTLSATMEGQASDLLGVKEQLSANQAQLEASTAEITSVRELIETVQSQSAQQAREGQLVTVQQSLQEQNSAAHSLHSELHAQLEVVQKQLEGGGQADEPSEEVEEEAASAEEEQAAPAEEVEEKEAAHLDGKSVVQEDSAVTEEQTAPAEEEGVEEEQGDLAEAAPEEVVEEVHAVENVEEQAEEEDSEAEDEQEEEQAVEEEEEQLEEDEASTEEEL
ncbi:neurofilament medium polypeptide isoform X2 [Salvelinus namaycush]|uniref:Neurofilament medium polypeptide isoform X2 n=1 Tax=Salvelinus namaycush TaxID=8040 RepID=A0A8U1ER22_SALNM|nr:neurofilament medium polypeptide isoform X2 [Salvelinus namaycush]